MNENLHAEEYLHPGHSGTVELFDVAKFDVAK
jgi:hypothetical protein